MQNNHLKQWVFIIILIAGIWVYKNTQTINVLRVELSNCQDSLDEANSNIENARSTAWSTYEDMGDALDSLEPVY